MFVLGSKQALLRGGAFAFLLLGLSLVCCSGPAPTGPRATAGRLDLSAWDFSTRGPLALDGQWDFFWQDLVGPGDPALLPTAQVRLPEGLWSSMTLGGRGLPPYGWATYRLRLVCPPTSDDLALRIPEASSASRVFVNGELVFKAGQVGTSAAEARSRYATGIVRFVPRAGENEILVQVSNFEERRGGLNRSLILGPPTEVSDGAALSLASDLLLFGVLLTMGVYHLVLFLLRRQDKTPLWFAVFCLVIAVRALLYGERFLFLVFPQVPWTVFQVADHLTFYLGIPLFAEYLGLVFHRELHRRWIRLYQILGLASALFLFFGPGVFNLTVVGYEAASAVAVLWVLWGIGRAFVHRSDGALVTVIGLMVFLVCAINEILHNLGIIHTFNTLSLGLVLFLVSQAVLLALRSAQAFADSEHLGRQLLHTNQALRRFIPQEFFLLLDCDEVTDIRLGDQVAKTMSVMFSDIRGFTTLAETLSSEETFLFLNSYYSRAGLAVRRHGGFIDKYFGDGFMTLFPNRPDDALLAAVDLQKAVVEYNTHRARSGYAPIEVGSGLHYGPLVLGTIGEKDRMDTTVIADAVNLSSRLEGLTKLYGKGTIVTMAFLDALEDPDQFHWRYLGLIRVHGRQEAVEAIHVYDGIPDDEWKVFHEGKTAFEEALALYRQGAFPEAQTAFAALALRYPSDPANLVYLSRINLLLKTGMPQDWDGVDTILTK